MARKYHKEYTRLLGLLRGSFRHLLTPERTLDDTVFATLLPFMAPKLERGAVEAWHCESQLLDDAQAKMKRLSSFYRSCSYFCRPSPTSSFHRHHHSMLKSVPWAPTCRNVLCCSSACKGRPLKDLLPLLYLDTFWVGVPLPERLTQSSRAQSVKSSNYHNAMQWSDGCLS